MLRPVLHMVQWWVVVHPGNGYWWTHGGPVWYPVVQVRPCLYCVRQWIPVSGSGFLCPAVDSRCRPVVSRCRPVVSRGGQWYPLVASGVSIVTSGVSIVTSGVSIMNFLWTVYESLHVYELFMNSLWKFTHFVHNPLGFFCDPNGS